MKEKQFLECKISQENSVSDLELCNKCTVRCKLACPHLLIFDRACIAYCKSCKKCLILSRDICVGINDKFHFYLMCAGGTLERIKWLL